LTVKIMEARTLCAPSRYSRPYVVATFEQNEFVSREAINEHEEDATGQPVSPQSSSAMRQGRNGNNGSANDDMETATYSAENPVWKHEVALCVDITQTVLIKLTDTLSALLYVCAVTLRPIRHP
jgi:hypothetical protein